MKLSTNTYEALQRMGRLYESGMSSQLALDMVVCAYPNLPTGELHSGVQMMNKAAYLRGSFGVVEFTQVMLDIFKIDVTV